MFDVFHHATLLNLPKLTHELTTCCPLAKGVFNPAASARTQVITVGLNTWNMDERHDRHEISEHVKTTAADYLINRQDY